MPRGHVKLGLPGELRDYLLVDVKARNKQLANPMAAKLGAGLGTYEDYQNYAGWVMSSWEAGISKRQADEGGTLYSELDTRFPEQVILPPYYDFRNIGYGNGGFDDNAVLPTGDTTPLVIGGTGANSQIAVKLTFRDYPDAMNRIFIPIYGSSGVSVTCTLYAAGAGDPDSGSNWGSATAILDGELGINYYSFSIAETGILSLTDFWVVLKPTTSSDTFTIPVKDYGSTGATRKVKGASSWANSSYGFFQHISDYFSSTVSAGDIAAMESSSDGTIYVGTSNTFSRIFSDGSVSIISTSGSIVDLCDFGDRMWVAFSGSTDAKTYTYAGATYATVAGIDANLFARWGGYLWRAYLNDVWYTVDGSTWYGPFQIGPDGYQVRGMAGLGDDMYVATDEGLYRVGAGDKVYGVVRWNQVSSTNGVGMRHHQGAIYIPAGPDLFQFNGSQVLPIGLNREEGLPQYKQGRVVSLCSHNYWLIALVRADDAAAGWSTVWAWNQQGWHYLASLPRGLAGNGITWQVSANKLLIGAGNTVQRIYLPKNSANPYRDSGGTAKFHPSGYFATNWYFGGLYEVQKDFESVYIAGENITTDRYVDVYYQDDESTDWEYLGRVTSNRQEIRWSDYDTRPNSRQLKLALVLTTDSYSQTPVVNAVRVKYQPMVMDRWRWSLPLSVTDNAQMPDNSNSPYTAQQLTQHLDMLLTRVAPFIYEDVDELRYEVKILSGGENLQTWDLLNGLPKLEKIYNVVIEQTTTGTYTG
jgi:hypothetical protein